MQHLIRPQAILKNSKTFDRFIKPLKEALKHIAPLESKSNHSIEFTFEHEALSLVYFNLHQFVSGNELVQELQEDAFARKIIAPPTGVSKSTFFETIGYRGLEQFQQIFSLLATQASALIPRAYADLGKLVVVDPTLITCTLSMLFAQYREGNNKAQAHIGFDPQRKLPRGLALTDGKANPRDFVPDLVHIDETGIFDRGFQCHEDFDHWDELGLKYVCRIKDTTRKIVIFALPVTPGGYILSDEAVVLGSSVQNYTQRLVRLVTFKAGSKTYWIATNRFDLTAEQIAEVFLLRWSIEIFFGWWKRFMRIYHLISRSEYGLTVQILSSLITYVLLAIYCHQQFGESVSIKRVRELQHAIRNESICFVLILLMPHPLFLYRYAKS